MPDGGVPWGVPGLADPSLPPEGDTKNCHYGVRIEQRCGPQCLKVGSKLGLITADDDLCVSKIIYFFQILPSKMALLNFFIYIF